MTSNEVLEGTINKRDRESDKGSNSAIQGKTRNRQRKKIWKNARSDEIEKGMKGIDKR
jgi:hypothetical protein